MSGGRHDYGLFFAAALIPLIALGVGHVLFRVSRREDRRLPSSVSGFGRPHGGERMPPGFDHGLGLLERRNNTRIFASTQVIALLVAFALLFIPLVVARGDSGDEANPAALFALLSGGGFALLGLLYASRKGDLGWVETLSSDDAVRGAHGPGQREIDQ